MMKALAIGCVAACLLAPAARAGGIVDFSDPEKLASSPCWSAGRIYKLYEDKGLGIHLLRIQPRGKRAVLRARVHMLTISLGAQSYYSTKIVSTKPGVKNVSKARSNFSFQRPGNVTVLRVSLNGTLCC